MTYEILLGDCIEQMRTLPDQSVHTCVTSPPYFGLRDYGHEGQIGLEETPDAFVAKLVEVFREVRRVLRDDGTLWLNLGDTYAQKGGRGEQGATSARQGRANVKAQEKRASLTPPSGLKPKDLIGIPWRVAFALQSDGWYLRQDIIWHKPNPMPESVRDRCTKAHEYVFMLSKGPRYYFDAEAIKEPAAESSLARLSQPTLAHQAGSARVPGKTNGNMKAVGGEMRNRRSVWTVTTKPYSGAHFATFPPDLIEPCILAGAPVGGTVLDPFGGSGTTAGVAVKHGRKAILCELNPEYAALIPDRVKHIAGDTCDLFSR
jgi:DNA modification methylase